MTNLPTTPVAQTATYAMETMSLKGFRLIAENFPGVPLGSNYSSVEYLSSPHGLVVLAHQDTQAGQIDGIHPSSISYKPSASGNIIKPFRPFGVNMPAPYSQHWLMRRSQAELIESAFGYNIDVGSPDAPLIEATEEQQLSVNVYGTPTGPIVGVFDYSNDTVHVIKQFNLQQTAVDLYEARAGLDDIVDNLSSIQSTNEALLANAAAARDEALRLEESLSELERKSSAATASALLASVRKTEKTLDAVKNALMMEMENTVNFI